MECHKSTERNEFLQTIVCFECGNAEYPSKINNYNPSVLYPEYLWGASEICGDKNEVYDMIRNLFIDMGYDQEHMNTAEWNPLSEIIKKNDTVLIKPNMVVSRHENLDCIVTHPSIIRALLDYVMLALKGTGRVIIGDAPMKRCVFEDVINGVGYDSLIDFYRNKNMLIDLIDFRSENEKDFVCCDLGKDSFFCSSDKRFKRYRVTNYDYRKMWECHNKKNHKYFIRREILEADVIISVPKLKTHKKAGITGACKNFVGTVTYKACLPHHIKGSSFFGGTEYLYPNPFKAFRTFCYERIDLCNIYHYDGISFWEKALHISDKLCNLFHADSYTEGNWYGNDTIWRMIGDLDRIVLYANKKGKMCETPCRKQLFVGDMIIAGEKEGPVHAKPKEQGIIIMADNPISHDCLQAKIMGFDYKKLPFLNNLLYDYRYPLFEYKYENITVISDSMYRKPKQLDALMFPSKFTPASGWIGHVELEDRC